MSKVFAGKFIQTSLMSLALVLAALLSAQTVLAQQAPVPDSQSALTLDVPTPPPPDLPAESYLLQDYASGDLLVAREPDLRVEPASITKLMTSYVVFHELAAGKISLDEMVTISENAWRTEGSRMFVEPDTQVSVEDLVKGMVIQSGNDASVALAEYIAGTEASFAGLMNLYAERLGLNDSNFTNATGLPDPDHYTTARDVATLSAALVREFPDYYTWYSEKEFTYNDIRQHNRNTLLWRDPAVDGLKTGHTESAGYCLASTAERDGMRLIAVVMGSASESSRANESQALLNYGFRFFETTELYAAGDRLAEAEVWKGTENSVALGLNEDFHLTVPRGRYDDLEAELEIRPRLSAPLEEGEVAGQLRIKLEGAVLGQRDVVALSAVPEAGVIGRSWDGLKLWMGGLWSDEDDDGVVLESDTP